MLVEGLSRSEDLELKVKMLTTVRPDFPFCHPNTIAVEGEVYEAKKNPHGAVSVITLGDELGVKPGEFCVVEEDFLD